jgi:hypothetical protein
VEFSVLFDVALDEEDRFGGVEAGGEVVEDDFAGVRGDLRGVGVVGGEGVPVGDEVVAVVLRVVLQADPVVQGAHIVAEVKFAGGAHAGEDALTGCGANTGRVRGPGKTGRRSGVRHWFLREGNRFEYCTRGVGQPDQIETAQFIKCV